MKKFIFICLFIPSTLFAQSDTKPDEIDKTRYENTEFYQVEDYAKKDITGRKVKNIIFLIGDGMGTAQVYSALVANKGNLYLKTMPYSGFSKTNSSDKLITDSAAGATAFSIGEKTYNGAIGVDKDKKPQKTILEMASESGMATGMVATCEITHATPASFIAHQPSRKMGEEIAAEFLDTDIDLFIGGGKNHFNKRKDGRNLFAELHTNGYDTVTTIEALKKSKGAKIAALLAKSQLPPYLMGRGDMLPESTEFAINKLNENDNGFFLMIEGSQIDWGGHQNNVPYIVSEMLDFDRAIGEVLKFAAQDGETLVVVTADHETGGFSINGGDLETGVVEGKFTTGGHTGVMVPVFSYGPQAERFSGIIENTDIFHIFKEVLGL